MPRRRGSRRSPRNRPWSYRARSRISGGRSSLPSGRARSPRQSRSSSGWSTRTGSARWRETCSSARRSRTWARAVASCSSRSRRGSSRARLASDRKPPLVVSGEVTHLGRSFLFAVRAGDVAEAESIFLGMVDEDWERKMAGDMLFRAALEDMGEGGRKLFLSVKTWQLARSLGFKGARTILRPAVDYLVKGPRDRSAFETILGLLGKEWVDLDALSSGGRALDDAGRSRVTAIA